MQNKGEIRDILIWVYKSQMKFDDYTNEREVTSSASSFGRRVQFNIDFAVNTFRNYCAGPLHT